MKKLIFLFMMMLLPVVVSAYDEQIDGIYYNFNSTDKTATVTYRDRYEDNQSAYSGDIVIPEKVISNGVTYSVTSIGKKAFYYCHGLTSVTIPNSVTSIGEDAFHGCVGLTSITIPNSVIYIGESAFMYCVSLTSVTIPNSVKTIDHEAFEDCSAMTSVIIGNGVATIGGEAFKDCSSLKSVVIGSGITTIMGLSFGNNDKLTDVYCYAETVPTTDIDTFKKTNIENVMLHVPSASISAYTEAAPWKNFKSIVPIEGTFPDDPDTPEKKKCAKPTISIVDGELEFSSETEGVEYVSEVTVSDAMKYFSSKVSLTGIYKVIVYATKAGYENSEVATTEIQLPINGAGKQGDLNGDGTIDVGDIMAIINQMARQTAQ